MNQNTPSSNKTPLEQQLVALFSIIPGLMLIWVLLQTWLDPLTTQNGAWLRGALALMLLEFVSLHSGAFLGALAAGVRSILVRWAMYLALAVVYALFVYGVALSLNDFTILKLYGLLLVGRFFTIVTAGPQDRYRLSQRAFIGIGAFVAAIVLTTILPVPEFGITHQVVNTLMPDRGTSVWESRPQAVIAAAILYFSIMVVMEVKLTWWPTPPKRRRRRLP